MRHYHAARVKPLPARNAAMSDSLTIDLPRLMNRLEEFNRIGALPGGGNCRLALSDEDRAGRDLLVRWMKDLGLTVTIDAIGNIFGSRPGREEIDPVMFGSHVDTVGTGGRYDGLLGVLAGLQALETLHQSKVTTRRPLVLAAFTNEEGSRFPPFAMGSLVFAGGMTLEQACAVKGIDGALVGDELRRIGYAGDAKPGSIRPHAYLELHIEQGPVLEEEKLTIGAVEGVQGLSWSEITIDGQSGHAGATPMRLRHDAGYVASEIAVFVRRLTREIGGVQVGTVGRIALEPGLINVIAQRARVSVDLRNIDEAVLQDVQARLAAFCADIAKREGVTVDSRSLARFAPVIFPDTIVSLVEDEAKRRGYGVRRLPSGAGHDAQMMARVCPAGMIFVPSVGGLSHNVKEHTEPEHLGAGANVLLGMIQRLAA
jgi:N-carbamoyl-L-amino-acid hydrolase